MVDCKHWTSIDGANIWKNNVFYYVSMATSIFQRICDPLYLKKKKIIKIKIKQKI
jgi:hypothetical protein